MKIKNIIKIFSFALFASAFQTYAMENFDLTERMILRLSSFHEESRDLIVQRDNEANVNHSTTKMKFNGGNLIKTTFDDIWEEKREGTASLEKAAYVIGIDDSSPPTRTQIVEHFWVNLGVRYAQTYLSIEVNQSAAATRSNMQYRFIDPFYQADPVTLRNWFNLTFQTYAEYRGITLSTLHIQVNPEHLAVFLSLLAPEIEQGLQVTAAPAA